MATGPHCIIEKEKPLRLVRQPERDVGDDSDGELPKYRFYESTKILGKLYRAIDEESIFSGLQIPRALQGMKTGSRRRSGRTVLKSIWEFVQHQCQLFQWDHHLDRARGIREE